MRALEEHPDNLDRAADWALLNFEQYQLHHPELFIEFSPEELQPPENDADFQHSSTKLEPTEPSVRLCAPFYPIPSFQTKMQETHLLSYCSQTTSESKESKPISELSNNNNTRTNLPMEVEECQMSIHSHQEQKDYYLNDSYTMNLLESDNKFYCRIHAQNRPAEFTIEQVHIGSYFRVGEMTEPYRNSLPLWLKTMDTVCFV
jgi:hypothetical protein